MRKDLLGSLATAQSEITLLLRSERTIWTGTLSNGTGDLRRDLTDVAERLERAERAALTRLDEVDVRLVALDRDSQAQSVRLDREQRQRRLAGARRDAARRPVEGVLLLICPQRVGSTWLFDLLRHHPAVEIFPSADVARRLGVSGRRYPPPQRRLHRRTGGRGPGRRRRAGADPLGAASGRRRRHGGLRRREGAPVGDRVRRRPVRRPCRRSPHPTRGRSACGRCSWSATRFRA